MPTRQSRSASVSVLTSTLLVLCFASCGDNADTTVTTSDNGRPETKMLEAASVVGYDGAGLRMSVDAMLKQNDQHNADINQALHSDPNDPND